MAVTMTAATALPHEGPATAVTAYAGHVPGGLCPAARVPVQPLGRPWVKGAKS